MKGEGEGEGEGQPVGARVRGRGERRWSLRRLALTHSRRAIARCRAGARGSQSARHDSAVDAQKV